ncbi:MAG: ATP synthase F1 subunit delta [Phycisphaeraceae bacterium]|nr:ATP synthase F1 subunit delta [Phycisphaerales bacterium]MCB9861295.1 ATP synthase F1 subunit delta [Phycisphaeraceae bacterium]
MPLIESEPDIVANTYANALFELARDAGGEIEAESVLAQLEGVLEIARKDAQFNEFLASLALPTEKRAASLKTMLTGNVSSLVLNFLLVLNDKGRLSNLPAIVRALDVIVQEHFGRVEVDVYTPATISAEALEALKSQLRNRLNKEVIVHPYTDSSMIGGIRLRIGDQLIDSSVATRLRRMGDQLKEQGLSSLRTNINKAIEGHIDD